MKNNIDAKHVRNGRTHIRIYDDDGLVVALSVDDDSKEVAQAIYTAYMGTN